MRLWCPGRGCPQTANTASRLRLERTSLGDQSREQLDAANSAVIHHEPLARKLFDCGAAEVSVQQHALSRQYSFCMHA